MTQQQQHTPWKKKYIKNLHVHTLSSVSHILKIITPHL